MESFHEWKTSSHKAHQLPKSTKRSSEHLKKTSNEPHFSLLTKNDNLKNKLNHFTNNPSIEKVDTSLESLGSYHQLSLDYEMEDKALEKLLRDDNPLNYILLFEMFEDKEFEELIQSKLRTSQLNSDRHFKLKLLWVDWLIQDQKLEESSRLLSDLLLFVDPEEDKINYSKISLALGKIATNSWKLTEALNHFHNVLEMENKLDEKSFFRSLDASRWIGIIKFRQALSDEAITLFKKCLNDATPSLGSRHPWIFAILLDLAYTYEQKWSLNEALRLGKEVLLDQKEFFQTSVYQTTRSYELLGSISFKQGNLHESRKMFEKALIILRKYRNKKHNDCVQIYLQIAGVYLALSYVDKALRILQKCRKILNTSEQKEGILMSKIYFYTGIACFYKRKFYDSIVNYTDSLYINTKLFGQKHPTVANDYQMIGRVLTIQGRYKEAQELIQKGLRIIRDIFGENSIELGKFYQSMGLTYLFQGELLWSMKSYKKCLLIQERCLNKEHYFLAMPYSGIARVYFKWGQIENALLNFEKSLDLWKFTLGNCHPKVASNYSDIGNCYTELELFDKSAENYEKALLSGYSAPMRHSSFEEKTFQKQRDSRIYLNLMSSLNG